MSDQKEYEKRISILERKLYETQKILLELLETTITEDREKKYDLMNRLNWEI